MILSGASCCFDITVEELKSFVETKQFVVKGQFADIFSLVLKTSKKTKMGIKRRKVSKNKTKQENSIISAKSETHKGQTILFKGNLDDLRSQMMKYPMELYLCSASDPEKEVGSALVPWNPGFIEYLMMSTYHKVNPSPPTVSNVHNVFHVATSKKIATLRLTIKLHLVDSVDWSDYKLLSGKYPNIFVLKDTPEKQFKNQSTSTVQLFHEGPGVIKTVYSGGKRNKKSKSIRNKKNSTPHTKEEDKPIFDQGPSENVITTNFNLINFIRSYTDTTKIKKMDLIHSKSCTAINSFNHSDNRRGTPFGNKIYTIGYFSVENLNSKSPSVAASVSSPGQVESKVSNNSHHVKSSESLDITLTNTVFCKHVECEHKEGKPMLEVPDDRTLLDLTNVTRTCCLTETMQQKMEIISIVPGDQAHPAPCYCACECSFNFEKKTTYCEVCKGYEKLAEDMDGKPQHLLPIPCPIYHKLKVKASGSVSGSETKKDTKRRGKSPDTTKEVGEEGKKKKKKDDRFKFQYGYKAPQIGHDQCVNTCAGPLSNVPKNMGWLWTAGDVPGLMFRPSWKPGAINKMVARKLKIAKNPGQVLSKRRKVTVANKRPLKRPLLIVHKKDGEYEVTMEAMKTYNKERLLNQPPYEDKPPMTYTIGRTEEENRLRQKKKERAKRRLEREQRDFIQSAFSNMCKDICLKTYQQALGITPHDEDPDCMCFPALPGPDTINFDRSCSCSDIEGSMESDTDSDEWILEFTPPSAYYDPHYSGTKVKTVDNNTQYTYLDYRVKLADRFGKPVPRFFMGPDGKQECSDFGGFWSADHKWLQINVDGYIGLDGRWAPKNFIGPSGEDVETETGKFQATNGEWLMVGVDGFVDCNNKWRFYKKGFKLQKPGRKPHTAKLSKTDGKKGKTKGGESDATFNCFGDVMPLELSIKGIMGHGPDKKLLREKLKDLIAKGLAVTIPQGSNVPKAPISGRKRRALLQKLASDAAAERFECRHRLPSRKGVTKDLAGTHYYKTKKFVSHMPTERINDLEQHGISLSAFHKPCFHSNLDCVKRPKWRQVVVNTRHVGVGGA